MYLFICAFTNMLKAQLATPIYYSLYEKKMIPRSLQFAKFTLSFSQENVPLYDITV